MATERPGDQGAEATRAASRARRRRPTIRGTRPFRVAITVLSVALVAMLGVFGGTAYAYFTASGSGSGNANVTRLKAVIITSGTPATTLLPGHPADLYLVVTDPNGALTITGISQAGLLTVTGKTGCTATNATVTVPTETGLSIPLNPGTNTITIANGAKMGTGSNTGCQNETFYIPVKLTVKS